MRSLFQMVRHRKILNIKKVIWNWHSEYPPPTATASKHLRKLYKQNCALRKWILVPCCRGSCNRNMNNVQMLKKKYIFLRKISVPKMARQRPFVMQCNCLSSSKIHWLTHEVCEKEKCASDSQEFQVIWHQSNYGLTAFCLPWNEFTSTFQITIKAHNCGTLQINM